MNTKNTEQVGEVQGDALPPLSADEVAAMAPAGLTWDETGAWAMGYEACRKAALAARQPVGQVPEWFELVIRDVCELESEDPDAADTVCIRALDLRLIMERHAAPPAQAVDPAPRPMNTAPRDGTLVRLLVDFDENAIDDSIGATWTIGACNDDNVSEGARIGWQFAGWCWTHDHFTEGTGTPVGWLPLIDGERDAAQGVDRG